MSYLHIRNTIDFLISMFFLPLVIRYQQLYNFLAVTLTYRTESSILR